MITMGRDDSRGGGGNGKEGAQSTPGAADAINRPSSGARLPQLSKDPQANISLLREVALGHHDPTVRWQCVCALAVLGDAAVEALAIILRESSDSVVRARADRALRPITVILGALVMTGTAFGTLHREDVKVALLRRHARGDWGELCRQDWEANERALFENDRLFSVYHDRSGQKFYIITEHDRSLTTILLSEDY
jgi:hypothetical protein